MADIRHVDNLRRLAPAEIQQLAFGVRYEPQFKVMDQIGTGGRCELISESSN